MMGISHAISGGTVAGAAMVWALPDLHLGYGPLGALLTVAAGAALYPDLDHHEATATTTFGPLTRGLHHGLVAISRIWYQATRARRDETLRGGHRTLTHTAPYAALCGVVTAAIAVAFPVYGSATIVAVAAATLARVAGRVWPYLVVGPVFAAMAIARPCIPPAYLGTAAAAGMMTHLIGDMLTRAGCPILAPLVPVRGRRWWSLRPPAFLTFRAGGPAEVVIAGALIVLGVYCAARLVGIL